MMKGKTTNMMQLLKGLTVMHEYAGDSLGNWRPAPFLTSKQQLNFLQNV